MFHEGRHAEQRFAVARYLVRQNPRITLKQIQGQAHVQEDVAREAKTIETGAKKQDPVSPAEDKSAQRMAGDIVGDGEEHIAIEHLAPQIGSEGTKAAELFHRLPPSDQQKMSSTWQGYRSRMIAVLDAYYQMPTEEDAFAAEKQLDDARAKQVKGK